jgi:hypothetical protein
MKTVHAKPPVQSTIYQAPWGWKLDVFDEKGKQIFSGAMYPSEREAEQALLKFLKARSAAIDG